MITQQKQQHIVYYSSGNPTIYITHLHSQLHHCLLTNQIAHKGFQLTKTMVKMALAQVVETTVPNNSPSQDSNRPGNLFQSRYLVQCNIILIARK